MIDSLLQKIYILPVVLLSLSLHELSHGLAAYSLGDRTAKAYGRLTLNPLAHLDLLGTISMLFFGFGWAKPVPVNFSRLKYKRLGPIIVSVAGPLSNLLLAFVCMVVFAALVLSGVITTLDSIWATWLSAGFMLNITLAVFNMIPIPPLDGSKVVLSLLPVRWQIAVYKNEHFIQLGLFALLYFGILDPVIDFFGVTVAEGMLNIVMNLMEIFF